jgi:Uncharacterized protein conserved in bacteria (DUF2252)
MSKRSVEIETLPPLGLEVYAQVCGWALARAHARSGDRIAIGAYLGRARASIRRSPTSPSATPIRTYAALADAAKSSRIEARTDLL